MFAAKHFQSPAPLRFEFIGSGSKLVVRGTGIRAFNMPSVEPSLVRSSELTAFVRDNPGLSVQVFRGPFFVAGFRFAQLHISSDEPLDGLKALALGAVEDVHGTAAAIALFEDEEGLCRLGLLP